MRTLVLASALLLSACPDRQVSLLTPEPGGAIIKRIPVSADLDVLFVIDNSGSTSDKQDLFRSNFQQLITALDTFPTGRPNLHVGVVDTTVDIHATGWGGCPSPDPADDGLLQTGSGCGVNGRFISDVRNTDNSRTVNYPGTLESAFTCMASSLGSQGCGFEAPLEAMKRALDGSRPENTGFLRPGATLAVIILTDEDDASVRDPAVFALPGSMDDFRLQPLYAYACDTPISASAPGSYTNCRARTDSYLTDPASYVQFLSTVKSPSQTVVAVIASPPPAFSTNDSPAQHANVNPDAIVTGPLTLNNHTQPLALQPSTTCTIGGKTSIGRPGLRLETFLSNYSSDHGRFYNVCQADYSAALTDISKTAIQALNPCLSGEVLIPLDCTVADVQNANTDTETRQPIPPCSSAPAGANCWSADQNPATCPAPSSGYELKISRTQPPPAGTVVEVQCAVGAQ